ncbi:MAG TPA: helix-turn-helix domain-containing protein [bacterium]|nr:helix-turn-helix domain-containing protein [bacterium]
MGTYGQYCPIAKGAEILAERWTPLIIRDVMLGAHRFNDIERGLPGISRSLLAGRLRQLIRSGVIERRAGEGGGRAEYHLTLAGRELGQVVDRLGEWAARWAFRDPDPEDRDPVLLMWWMHGRINRDLLPPRRVVVRFDFRRATKRCIWLVLERSDVSVCPTDPGFDTDLVVTTDIGDLYRVWLGRITFGRAVEDGLIEMDGPPALARAFPRWLQLSPLAGAVQAAARSSAG